MFSLLRIDGRGRRAALLLGLALALILVALPSAAIAAPATNGPYIHVVQKGQTLSGIAAFMA